MDKKTFLLNGKMLSINEIDSNKNPSYQQLSNFLHHFYNEDSFFQVTTSGSTGIPKQIKIEKKYMIASAQKTLKFLEIPKGAKILMCLPFDKIGGIMVLVRWLAGDLDLYMAAANSNPLKDWDENFDFCSMVPFQVTKSFNQLSKIKTLLIGGADIDSELENKIARLDIRAFHSYGMTETISHIALRRVGEFGVFKTMPNVVLSQNSKFCLIINAPDIGVVGLPTNDVVELINSNEFIWKGRIDNVINSGGIKFYPEEIENKIGSLGTPYFISSRVDEELGERLIILIEGEPSGELDFANLSKYERPKEVIFISEFLRTKTGKIRREKTLKSYLKKST